MSDIALVIIPGSEALQKAVDHPAGLSSVKDGIRSPIPYESHDERIKLTQMAVARMQAPKPEDESAHTGNPVVDHKGREAGGKAPHDKGSTAVSGSGSQASENFGRKSYVVKPSEIGSSAPESATAHQVGKVPSVKR